MVGWHHPFNGHEFEQAPGIDDGHGCLAGYIHGFMNSQSDTTEQLTRSRFSS